MIIAKRFALIVLGFLIFFFVAFWGFKNNFPSKSFSRLLQTYLTKQLGMPIEIKDLDLGWQKISTKEILIFSPKWVSSKNKTIMLVFDDIESPF